jgi:hypothetical protein
MSSRPFFALLLMATEFAVAGSIEQTSTVAFVGCFAALPLLWMVGILPTVEGFLPWAGETVLVHGCGGSPMVGGNIRSS